MNANVCNINADLENKIKKMTADYDAKIDKLKKTNEEQKKTIEHLEAQNLNLKAEFDAMVERKNAEIVQAVDDTKKQCRLSYKLFMEQGEQRLFK